MHLAYKRLTDGRHRRAGWPQVNLTSVPVNITLTRFDEPFMQDNYTAGFPPASRLTFAEAFDTLLQKLGPGAAPKQLTFRRPLHPCASEDLFQFSLYNSTAAGVGEAGVASIGLVSTRLCKGFVTQPVGLKMCAIPSCWD